MTPYRPVTTATSADGQKIRVGDTVRLRIHYGGVDTLGPEVTVRSLHAQGYDGTIVTTDPAPDPDFPHHFSGRAKRFYKVLTPVLCAWCPGFDPKDPANAGVSHGMCPTCLERELAR